MMEIINLFINIFAHCEEFARLSVLWECN